MNDGQRVRASARGGQSNELGSAYRAGVAAYLAAHSLASQPARHIGLDDESSTPLIIKVESDEAVDDLLCEMPVGQLLMQAKRTCGIDAHFRATVDQWVAVVQEGGVGVDTRLVLVTGKAKGMLRDLRSALARHRNPDAQVLSSGEKRALDNLVDAVGDRLDEDQMSLLLDAAIVVEVAVEGVEEAAFREAARLLEGTVVRAGDGIAAMKALQHHFQRLGAMRWASNRETWRQVLRDAGLDLLEDPGGGWSARRSAIEGELDAYRSHLSSRLNEFPLNLLTTDLPPMHVDGLVSTYQVALPTPDSGRSDGLAEVCRRWRRVVVVGLPGSGKSSALEQIAASWASRDDAPVPVLVALRPFLRSIERRGTTITLAKLIDHAVESADRDTSILGPELRRRCEVGEAALLLDGLDECRGKAATVADAVANVAAGVPDSTSVILTTRKSALPAASKLGLPEVELVEPYRLESTLNLLLDHVARCRIPEPNRRAWLRERQQRLEEVRRETSQLLRVPLMAVLFTLLVAEKAAPRARAGRAELLAEVVKDSVKRWESTKPKAEPSNPDLQAGMLLDAFSEIGHVLTESRDCTRAAAERSVTVQFQVDWGLAPRQAMDAAEAAVSFWDDRVGVFVLLPPDETIEPRSRVFVEIAEAMWIGRQAMPAQREWLRDALSDTDRRETVLLAAGLWTGIAELLIDMAEAEGLDAVMLAADALSGAPPVTPSAQRKLVHLIEAKLLEQATPAEPSPGVPNEESAFDGFMRKVAVRQGNRDGPLWPMVRRLAQLRLDESLCGTRARIIDGLRSEEQRTVARALSAVSQVSVRGGEPTEVEIEHMVGLLQEPLPESDTQARRVSRRHIVVDESSWSPLSGFGDGLVGCIQWLPEVDEELARFAWHAAQHTSMGQAIRIEWLLAQHGRRAVVAELNRERYAWMSKIRFDGSWDSMRRFYAVAADMAPPSVLTVSQAWRLETLADMTTLLGLAELGVGTLDEAFTRAKRDMEFLIPLCADRAGLDIGALAGEAELAMELHDRGAAYEVAGVLFVPPPPGKRVSLRRAPLENATQDRLIEILCGGAELPFILARRVLHSTGDEALAALLRGMLGEVPAWHRGGAVRLIVLLAANRPETTLALLAEDDAVVRVAAASLVGKLIKADPDHSRLRTVLNELAGSRDYSMRAALLEEVVPSFDQVDLEQLVGLAQGEPEYWTCCDCGRRQSLSDLDCRDCRTGTRPDLPEAVGKRFVWYLPAL